MFLLFNTLIEMFFQTTLDWSIDLRKGNNSHTESLFIKLDVVLMTKWIVSLCSLWKCIFVTYIIWNFLIKLDSHLFIP